MRALVFDADAGLRLDAQHPEPQPRADEALVHVCAAGICDTDLQLIAGYAGFRGVLGHEFVGRVDAADPELGARRVVANINIGCGRCPLCLANDAGHCRVRQTLGIHDRPGVLAERVAIPRRQLVTVPESVDDECAVFAEPLAAALHVLDELDQGPGSPQHIEVLGDGKLGLLIALALRGAGHHVRCIGHHRDKLQRIAASGVQLCLEAELEPDERGRAAWVVEATGAPGGLARALWLAAPRATIVLKSTMARPAPVDLSSLVVHEQRLVGSRCGDMQRAVELLARAAVDPRPLIDARYPLAAAEQAIAHAARPGTLKVLLRPH